MYLISFQVEKYYHRSLEIYENKLGIDDQSVAKTVTNLVCLSFVSKPRSYVLVVNLFLLLHVNDTLIQLFNFMCMLVILLIFCLCMVHMYCYKDQCSVA